MIPTFIEFDELKPGTHALSDASSLREFKEHACTLTDRLNPATARTILHDLDAFGLKPSLNLLERWIVVNNLAADLIAVDSVNGGTAAVKSFRYEPDEVDRITLDNSQLETIRDEAFVDHIKARLLASTWLTS